MVEKKKEVDPEELGKKVEDAFKNIFDWTSRKAAKAAGIAARETAKAVKATREHVGSHGGIEGTVNYYGGKANQAAEKAGDWLDQMYADAEDLVDKFKGSQQAAYINQLAKKIKSDDKAIYLTQLAKKCGTKTAYAFVDPLVSNDVEFGLKLMYEVEKAPDRYVTRHGTVGSKTGRQFMLNFHGDWVLDFYSKVKAALPRNMKVDNKAAILTTLVENAVYSPEDLKAAIMGNETYGDDLKQYLCRYAGAPAKK